MGNLTRRLQRLQRQARRATEEYETPSVCRNACLQASDDLFWILMHSQDPAYKSEALPFLQDLSNLEDVDDVDVIASFLLVDYYCVLRAYALHSRSGLKETMQLNALHRCEDVDTSCGIILAEAAGLTRSVLPPRPARVTRREQRQRLKVIVDNPVATSSA